MNRAVLSLHGIRTRGVWQKALVPILSRNGFIPYPLDYGYFGAVQLLIPCQRDKMIERLRKELEAIPEMRQDKKCSIIAHSFGAYLVGRLLEKYPMFKFDKVIFAGSILNEDYNWPEILARGQVNLFRNDYGRLDIWPQYARALVRGTGDSGTRGFLRRDNSTKCRMVQKPFPLYRHSDYFHPKHFDDEWIPTLETLVLGNDMVVTPKIQAVLVEIMNVAIQRVGQSLSLDHSHIRANIFAMGEDGRLSIPHGLHYNMDNQKELTISIPTGTGCTGTAFSSQQPAIAVFDHNWGQYTLPDPELEKVDRRLQWIVSMPIPDPIDANRLLGILNVDCLYMRKDRDELAVLLEDLRRWAQTLGAQLGERGHGGEYEVHTS